MLVPYVIPTKQLIHAETKMFIICGTWRMAELVMGLRCVRR